MIRTRWIDEANSSLKNLKKAKLNLLFNQSQITLASSHYAKNVMCTVLCLSSSHYTKNVMYYSTVPRDGLASTNSWLICCLLPSIRPRNSFVLAPIAILQKIELAHATFTVPVAALIVPFLAPCMLLGPDVPELLASKSPPCSSFLTQ